MEDDRVPSRKAKRQAVAETVGADGVALLTAIHADDAPRWLRELPAVAILRQVWLQNYVPTGLGTVRWRTTEDGLPPSATFISSPYDTDAHYAIKRTTAWVGYKVHLTETCDDSDETPHLITHVATTAGPTADGAVTPRIHAALHQHGLLPATHLVDTGFLDAELLVTSKRDYAVELLEPTRRDYRWQARAAQGFGSDHFLINWDAHTTTCPLGRKSSEWVLHQDVRGNAAITFRFATSDCGPCPAREICTQSPQKYPCRLVTIRPHDQYVALQERRRREITSVYAKEYAHCAGIEGTISQGVRHSRCAVHETLAWHVPIWDMCSPLLPSTRRLVGWCRMRSDPHHPVCSSHGSVHCRLSYLPPVSTLRESQYHVARFLIAPSARIPQLPPIVPTSGPSAMLRVVATPSKYGSPRGGFSAVRLVVLARSLWSDFRNLCDPVYV